MRHLWNTSAFLGGAFFCLTISVGATLAQDAGSHLDAPAAKVGPSISREILFTSKLMGYFRLPDQQPFVRSASDPRCPLPGKGIHASPDAEAFIDNFRNRPIDSVLVGTGDNFAPNYYARVLQGAPSTPGKELYQWNGTQWLWYRDVDDTTNAGLQEGMSTIPTDNVGCFLSYVRYDAIVPGKHDFYYGPERLRNLARFIAGPPQTGTVPSTDTDFQPVQMLAANMMIKTSWANDHTPIPDSGKPLLPFASKYVQVPTPGSTTAARDVHRSLEIGDFADNGFAFPWMRFVRVNGTGWDIQDLKHFLLVYLCEAEPNNPDDFLNHGGFCKNQKTLSLDSNATTEAEIDSGSGSLVYDLPDADPLQPGHNYAICIPTPETTVDHRKDAEALRARPYCFRFSVYNPFFQFPDWNLPGHNPASGYKNPDLWVVREGDGKTPVVIFGVVDPLLQEHVGVDNFAWRTVKGKAGSAERDKRYTTQLAIADPLRALIHLEDYFEEEYHREHKRDFEGIRVLLAQMPPEAVKQLAEHLPRCLRFDVILSAADDGLATPNQLLQYLPTKVEESRTCGSRVGSSGLKMKTDRVINGALATPVTFIAVPPSHEQPVALPATHLPAEQKSRFVQVRTLQITGTSRPNLTYALKGDPIPVPVTDTSTLARSAEAFWQEIRIASGASSAGPWDEGAKKSAIQQLALWSIHKAYQTDVALLQQRDFYPRGLEDYLADHCTAIHAPDGTLQCDPNSSPALDYQEILDRIIWKGDYIEVKSVQGTVLKSVLKQSNQFGKAEKTPYLSVTESGRTLVKLGIQADEKNGGDYLINDKPLDPSALYTVATSDYIGLGDTGYPDLSTEPVGTPVPPASTSGQIVTISGATCETLSKLASTNCRVTLHGKDYYDELVNQTPDDSRKGNSSWHKFYAWTFLHQSLGQPTPKHKGEALPGPDEISAQMQRRVDSEKNWDFSLDKASVGFTALTHNGSEQDLSQEFGGVQNGDVNAKHAHSWAWDLNSKYTMFHKKYDLFASEGMSYSSSFTAQLSGPRSETQSRNQFAVDWGTYLHPWAKDKKLWQLASVLAGHFETQLANPLTNISLSPVPPSTNSSTLTFKQGRTRLLLGRMGARFQNRKSFVEAGIEGGETLNAIQAFNILTAPGGPSVTCFLQASLSLSKCVKAFNKDNPQTPVTSNSQVSVIRSPQPRYGAYWNVGLNVPINPTISYNFQDSSDYFFNSSGDNSADTRYRHKLVNTLKFTVFPNLSFEPTYTIFLYENKLDYQFLFQQQYSVNINYSFDWSNWHERKQQLKYKK